MSHTGFFNDPPRALAALVPNRFIELRPVTPLCTLAALTADLGIERRTISRLDDIAAFFASFADRHAFAILIHYSSFNASAWRSNVPHSSIPLFRCRKPA